MRGRGRREKAPANHILLQSGCGMRLRHEAKYEAVVTPSFQAVEKASATLPAHSPQSVPSCSCHTASRRVTGVTGQARHCAMPAVPLASPPGDVARCPFLAGIARGKGGAEAACALAGAGRASILDDADDAEGPFSRMWPLVSASGRAEEPEQPRSVPEGPSRPSCPFAGLRGGDLPLASMSMSFGGSGWVRRT
jgi:hypothetical protein